MPEIIDYIEKINNKQSLSVLESYDVHLSNKKIRNQKYLHPRKLQPLIVKKHAKLPLFIILCAAVIWLSSIGDKNKIL